MIGSGEARRRWWRPPLTGKERGALVDALMEGEVVLSDLTAAPGSVFVVQHLRAVAEGEHVDPLVVIGVWGLVVDAIVMGKDGDGRNGRGPQEGHGGEGGQGGVVEGRLRFSEKGQEVWKRALKTR